MSPEKRKVWVCNTSSFANGAAKGVRLKEFGSDDFFVVNRNDQIFAYENSCPHWPGSTLPIKKDTYLCKEKLYITCHGHGALFDVPTGRCISGPCEGEHLSSLEVVVDENGEIFVLL
ncbi:Rieske 2Fe-2S domain-containing protein [Pseudomonas sp. Irchel s3f7]|uniref:Rieske (2Fe-2S) protein n=1 Tax=Pseudomonas sp. Irchel s3f7 TaxID=2009153 RepID=UPI000BA38B50